eukprot:1980983-Ditylum_brightwellii.AAC.1
MAKMQQRLGANVTRLALLLIDTADNTDALSFLSSLLELSDSVLFSLLLAVPPPNTISSTSLSSSPSVSTLYNKSPPILHDNDDAD